MTSKRLVGLLAMVLMSAQAFAMRVGDLQTDSRLNEPLRATIMLGDLTALEAQNLDVRVADAQTYERLGLERGVSVEGLSFTLGEQSGNKWPLELVGNRAIREPYLVLLLDIRSSSGRALREFTILLDPGPAPLESPVTDAEAEAEAEAATTAAAAELPAPETYALPESTTAGAAPQPEFTSRAPDTAAAVVGNQPMVSSKDYQYARQQSAYGDEYGPVRAGESLSVIGNKLAAPTGAHAAQVIWGLYDSNPMAFEGSINKLKRGAMLTVPSASELTAISIERARTNIRAAAAVDRTANRASVSRDAPAVTLPSTIPTREEQSAEGLGEDPREMAAEFRDLPASEAADLAMGSDTSGLAGEQVPADTSTDVADSSSARPEAGAEFDAEFADSEFDNGGSELLEDGAEPAQAAAGAQTTSDGFAVEEPASAPKVVITDPSQSSGILAMISQWLLPIIGAVVVALLLLVLAIRSRRSKVQEPAFVSEQAPEKPRPNIVDMARGEKIPDPTEAVAEDADTVVLDTAPLADDGPFAPPSKKGAAADVDDVFGDLEDLDLPDGDDAKPSGRSEDEEFAALLQAEPAAPEEAEDTGSTELGELDVDFGEPPVDTETTAPAAEEPKSMFETASFPLVNDDAESKSAASGDDPVAEAEFQLAYGLYDEAEETLKAVLEVEPGRLDAMEKLAEVYFAAGREDDFEALAKDLKQSQGMTQEFRNVEALAQQLIPNSSLFTGSAASPQAEPATDSVADADPAAAFDLETAVDEPALGEADMAAADSEPGPEPEAETTESAQDTDIEMVAFDMPEPAAVEAEAPPVASVEPMETVDFDLPELESEPAADKAVAKTEFDDTVNAHAELDEISLAEPDATPAADELNADAFELDDSGLDIGDLDAGELDTASLETGELDTSELDDSGFDFDADGLSLEGLDDAADELSLEGLSLDDEPASEGEGEAVDVATAGAEFTLDEGAAATEDDGLSLDVDNSQTADAGDTLSLESFDSDLGDELLGLDEQAVSATADDAVELTLDDLEAPATDAETISLEMPADEPDSDEIGLQAFDDGINDDGDMNGKLDLARGYVDMGEIDMARSLLDEVVTRGNDDQQAEARSMLESLA